MSFNASEHMLNLKGKDYLQVMWRLVWFREDCPLWSIDTQLVTHDADNRHAIFRAVISDESGQPKSSGYGSESAKDFGDYIEKAETKAVGRALAMLGYGTQFAPELDEESRIVDSPVAPAHPATPDISFRCEVCGAKITPVAAPGGKMPGIRQWCEGTKAKFGRQLCADCVAKLNESKAD